MEKERKIMNIDKHKSFLNTLRILAPGAQLRTAIENIVKAKMGALIVINVPGVEKAVTGGFKINCKFTPQRLVELCKMDGAVILSNDMKKILNANVLLVPDHSVYSKETGTRHQAAERTSKQFKTFVISVSERRKTVTAYYDDIRYVLRNTQELLRRATESLQMLERRIAIFSDYINQLDVAEFLDDVKLNDVCTALQQAEIINKISSVITRYIIELGNESGIIKMSLPIETIKEIEKEKKLILTDYSRLNSEESDSNLSYLSFDDILDIKNIMNALGQEEDMEIKTRGYRMLSKTEIEEEKISKLIEKFKDLKKIFESDEQEFREVLDYGEARKFKNELGRLKNEMIFGRRVSKH